VIFGGKYYGEVVYSGEVLLYYGGSVVSFEGKLRISRGEIAALGEVQVRLYWASEV